MYHFRSTSTLAWHPCSIVGTYCLWCLPEFFREMESTRHQIWTTWSDRRIENWHFWDFRRRRVSLEVPNISFYHQRFGKFWTQIRSKTQLQKRPPGGQLHRPSLHPNDQECGEFHLYRKPIFYGVSKFLECWPTDQLQTFDPCGNRPKDYRKNPCQAAICGLHRDSHVARRRSHECSYPSMFGSFSCFVYYVIWNLNGFLSCRKSSIGNTGRWKWCIGKSVKF